MKLQVVGQRYRLKSLIGEGGMASVYAAVDEKLDREIAIKIMHQHLARNSDIRDRFLLEARTVSTLDHPNILKVYDFSGLESEQLWIVTEILHGVDLAEYVKRFPKTRLHPLVAALIVREICRALREVHKLKIVHRDVKPENIMVLHTGQVKLMDFGIAKVHRANATQTGTFMGSPSYMSPEQIRGADVDVRADIYSLCVLFYEILTGSMPYFGQTTAEVINKIMQGRYTPPDHLVADLPKELVDLINRGLKNAKEDRFPDIDSLAAVLDRFISTCGFSESRLELERFVLQRKTFEQRLALLKFHPSPEARDLSPTRVEVPNKGKVRSPQQTEIFDAPHKTIGPDGQRPSALREAPLPGRSSRIEAAVSAGKALKDDKDPATERKVYVREYGSGDRIRKGPSTTLAVAMLLSAIAFVFILGGDRLTTRLKRDTARVTQQLDGPNKKSPLPGSEAPDLANARPGSERTPEAEPPPVIVESQTVTIDGKNPPKVSKKEITATKPARPSSTRTNRPDASAGPKRPTVASVDRDILPVQSSGEKADSKDSIPQEKSRERGTLRIATLPAAEILVDGKLYGTTNERSIITEGLKLEPGSYQVKLRRKGYRTDEQVVAIRSGETRHLSVSLSRAVELVEFTIRSNRIPALVLIEDVRSEGRRRELTLSKNKMVFNLKPGQYRVFVSYGKETINRVIELNEADRSITFSAEFK